MTSTADQLLETADKLDAVIRNYTSQSALETKLLLASLRPAEIANVLASFPPKVRTILWDMLEDETRSQTLQHLNEEVRAGFLEDMDTVQLAAVAEELEADDFADILHQLPQSIADQVLNALSTQDRARVEAVLAYDEDSAGGLMNTDTVTVRPRHALELVFRYLRMTKSLPDTTDALIVVNSRDEYVGMLPLAKLLTSDPTVTVREVMDSDAPAIPVSMSDTEVARMFSDEDLVSAAVVDDAGKLLGRITIDDVVDVIIEDADEAVLARAGLDLDEDTFAPIPKKSVRRRAIWLGINLITAFLAAAVINIFEETIAPRWWRWPCSCPSSPAWAAWPVPRH